ncbi:MAG: carboxypeptidase regulatory-like domain-containing protein [Bryobacteraceae bacterium]
MKRSLLNTANLIGTWLAASVMALACAAAADGGIAGTLADPSGAPVPGVEVVAVASAAVATKGTATTDAEGHFRIDGLPAGTYQVTVRQPGFRTERLEGVEVRDGRTARADIGLELLSRNDAVVVTESLSRVDATEMQMGEPVTAAAATAAPVASRSYTDMLALEPGVVPVSSQQPNAVVMSGCTSTPPSGDLNPGSLSINGQRETGNGFYVNGNPAQEDFNMGAAVVPNLDSIQQLRVLTNTFDAEYGNFSGGQVLVSTKSGSGEWHGSAFEFLRNTDLDSRNFFASRRARFQRNEFGGTLGGPLRKESLFFFADYQGTRLKQGVDTGLIPVPSLANRAGDFSDLAGTLTGTVSGPYWANLLSQKLHYGVTVGEHYYFPGCSDPADCVLPNARIPQSAWAAPAEALLPYVPAPNAGTNLFETSAYNQTLGDDKGSLRLDANTRRGTVTAHYFADHYRLDNPYPTGQGGASVPGFNATSVGTTQMATLGWTSTFGSSAVNELHAGYLRDANNIGQPVGGVGPSLASQGFTGIVPLAPKIEGIENVAFNDFTIGVDTTGVVQANNTYQWSDQFSKTAGKHLLKFGGGMHFDQVNINPDAIYNGSFLFQGSETGVDFADFLLGIASSYSQGDSQAFYLRNIYAGWFAQDSWRVRTGLTIDLGLRWDLLPPWREKYNQLQTLVPGQQSVVYPGAPAGLVFPGDPGIPSTLAPAGRANFAPRLGLAWARGKTTLRLGYGIFYTAFEGLSAGIMSANPPYGYDYDSLAPPLFTNPFIGASDGTNVGQRFPEPNPALGASAAHPNGSVDWSQYLPITGVPSFFHGNVTPRSESYVISLDRELAPGTVASVRYAGSQAHHLLVLISANPGDPALCLSLSQPAEVAPGTSTCGPFGESGVYTRADGTVVEGTRTGFPPQFAAVTYQKTIGNSNFNALEATLRHSRGPLELLAGYTYGKSLDQSSSLSEAVNPLNPSLSRALSAFDLRHNFVASGDWKLPLGFSVSAIARFSTGLPVTLYNNNDTSLLGTIPNGINNNGVDTPDVQPGNLEVNTNPRNSRAAFRTALFSLPQLGETGTAARRSFYGPGMANVDLALHKTVKLSERRTLELRAEAFNAFNHAQFFGAAAVDGNIASSGFSRIVGAQPPRLVQLAAKFAF